MTGEEYYKLWRERHLWRPVPWAALPRTQQTDWMLAAVDENLCIDQIPYGYALRRRDESFEDDALSLDLIGLLDG